MREGRAAWKRAGRHGILALKINERDLSPEYVMRLWLNGYYFQDEPALEAELRTMVPAGQMLSRQVFLDYVYRAIEVVVWTASVLEDALRNGALH